MSEANHDAASRPMDRIVTRDDLGGNEIEIAALPEPGLLPCPFCRGNADVCKANAHEDGEVTSWRSVFDTIATRKKWNARACAKDNAND